MQQKHFEYYQGTKTTKLENKYGYFLGGKKIKKVFE